MDERLLAEALRGAEPPDSAGARARSRRTVLAAYAARPATSSRGSARRRLPIAAIVALGIGLALGGAGVAAGPSRVAGWAGSALHLVDRVPDRAERASALRLAGGGRLLVRTRTGTWVLGAGPPQRVGGPADRVTWSAFGRYLARVRGERLQAVALDGRVAWTLRFDAPVEDPVWSPDGNRIAMRVGGRLHVTAGDGTGPHAVRAQGGGSDVRVSAVAPAWRPGAEHVVAVASPGGRVTVLGVDDGRVRWRARAPSGTLALGWSRDARRLLVAGRSEWRLLGARGRVLARARTPHATRIVAAAIAPSGEQMALVREQIGATTSPRRVALLVEPGHGERTLIAGHDLRELAYAPDGRWLLVGWPRVDGWLFFATGRGDTRARVVEPVSSLVAAADPVVEGWCCHASRSR